MLADLELPNYLFPIIIPILSILILLIYASLFARLYSPSHSPGLRRLIKILYIVLLALVHLILIYKGWLYLIGVNQATELVIQLLVLGGVHIEIIEVPVHVIPVNGGCVTGTDHLIIQILCIELAIDTLLSLAHERIDHLVFGI